MQAGRRAMASVEPPRGGGWGPSVVEGREERSRLGEGGSMYLSSPIIHQAGRQAEGHRTGRTEERSSSSSSST